MHVWTCHSTETIPIFLMFNVDVISMVYQFSDDVSVGLQITEYLWLQRICTLIIFYMYISICSETLQHVYKESRKVLNCFRGISLRDEFDFLNKISQIEKIDIFPWTVKERYWKLFIFFIVWIIVYYIKNYSLQEDFF